MMILIDDDDNEDEMLSWAMLVFCWGLTNKPNSEHQKSVQLTEFEYGGTHGQSWTTHA